MAEKNDCIFCHYEDKTINAENRLAVAFPDKFPKAEGHTLIVTRRHIEDISEATDEEVLALFNLLKEIKENLEKLHGTSDFKIFINRGEKAGQVIPHMHIHCLPCY